MYVCMYVCVDHVYPTCLFTFIVYITFEQKFCSMEKKSLFSRRLLLMLTCRGHSSHKTRIGSRFHFTDGCKTTILPCHVMWCDRSVTITWTTLLGYLPIPSDPSAVPRISTRRVNWIRRFPDRALPGPSRPALRPLGWPLTKHRDRLRAVCFCACRQD